MGDLTLRGACFLGAGLAALVCGMQLGQGDFVRIGLLALLAPALAWGLVRWRPRELEVRRRLPAAQVEAGTTTLVTVEVTNHGRRTGSLLVAEDTSAALGGARRFAVADVAAGATTTLTYPVASRRRGRHRLGPLRLHDGDPFGLVDVVRTVGGPDAVTVTPRTRPLPTVDLRGRWSGSGGTRARELLGGGTPDVTVRDYRRGDELRRIHWPTSARTGELMVRREEQEWQLRCDLLLDDRRRRHRGGGPHATLETAVEAAASVLRHLAESGWEVRLHTSTTRDLVGLERQLEHLALLTASAGTGLPSGWRQALGDHGPAEHSARGLVVAVVAHLEDAERRQLGRVATSGRPARALVVESGEDGPTGAAATLAALRREGWRAQPLGGADSLPAAWTGLAR